MTKILYIFFTVLTFFSSLAQEKYKLYVEGEKQWAYKENYLTDFVYAFCTKDFEAMAKNPPIEDKTKVPLFKELYHNLLQAIPQKNENTQISLFFGERMQTDGRIFFMTFFEGDLKGKRKDAFFQFILFTKDKKGIFKYEFIDISDEKHRITYKEPTVQEKAGYQQEVMQEYASHAMEKNAKKKLENYINTRKRWKNLKIMINE